MLRYPQRLNCDFKFIAGGDGFLPELLRLLDDSESEVLFEMYLVEPGRAFDLVLAALLRSAARGVKVYLLLDGFGSRRVVDLIQQICAASNNIQLCIFNPISLRRFKANFLRDHRKIVIVDADVALISGFGIVDNFYAASIGASLPEAAWLDVAVVVKGGVVEDWRHLFANTWSGPALLSVRREYCAVGAMTGRVAFGACWSNQDIMRELGLRILRARKVVWIVSPYFVTSWRIRRLLRKAGRRGIDVRLLVPGGHSDHPPVHYASKRHYRRLLRAGVRIFEFQAAFIHAKMYLCDGWVSIGSFNLDHWTYRFNLEANQEVEHPEFVAEVAGCYEQWLLQSNEITTKTVLSRGVLERVLIYLLGRVDAWLMRLFK